MRNENLMWIGRLNWWLVLAALVFLFLLYYYTRLSSAKRASDTSRCVYYGTHAVICTMWIMFCLVKGTIR